MSKILMLDNYDSFTFNLVQYLGELGAEVIVKRNDQIDCQSARALRPDALVISPGPCTPREAGVSVEFLRRFAGDFPILGVCLGHQCIAEAFGGRIVRAGRLMHGKVSPILHDCATIFSHIPTPFDAIRYHSLLIEPESLPACLAVSAKTAEGEIMGVRHKHFAIEGVQFHPESILTEHGKALLSNFLKMIPQ